jgi:hypothetical protein
MHDIHTDVTVEAPAETVWAVLTDFEAYGEWNPTLAVEGRPEEGARLRVSPGPEAGGPTFRPRVVRVDPGRELTWRGKLYVRGLFDGVHSFRIEDVGEGRSRLVQDERFSGLLVRPILARYGAETERNFHAANEALARRAEHLAAGEVAATGAGTAR